MDLSVVVPAYNEESRLAPTLDALRARLTERGGSWELIVVDDGSTDDTHRIALAAAADEPRIHVIHGEHNRGKGHALRRGVLASYGHRVLITDADLATPIEELDRLEKELSAEPAEARGAAIGSRARPGATIERHQHRLRELLGRAGNCAIRALAVPGIRDTQCGFKLFDGDRAREAFAVSRLDGWTIDVEILQYLRRAGLTVTEVPVRWAHQSGSKVRPRDYAKVLGELTLLKARTIHPTTLLVPLLFLVLAVFLYRDRWADPGGTYLFDSGQDQNQWEWFFKVTSDNVLHLRNPLFTTLQNAPDGVNLMANTVMLGLSVPLAPVTALFGPALSLLLVMTLGLAGTATAWYWMIRRQLSVSWPAAAVGAALAAFAPPMISHANAHPNFVVLFMIPLIIDRALRLCDPDGPVVRNGVLLGLFATYQVLLGEEALLLAVVGMLLFALAYAALRPQVARTAWRSLLRGLGVAAAVALPLLAVPLYWQFFGPQSYKSVLHGDGVGNSPLALLSFADRSLAGDRDTSARLAINFTEQNAFYGWPLVALVFAIVVRLWERALVKALAFTAVVAALLSLGPKFRIPMTDVELTGPWRLLAHQPLFESVIESRVAMVCAPALGMLVALAVDRLGTARISHRVVGYVAVAAALLPIAPTPFKTTDRVPVPRFYAEGMWRSYVDEARGETVVPIPVPNAANAEALHWQTSTDLAFKLPGGYFNGPWGPDRMGIYGPVPRNTSNLLRDVADSGKAPGLSDAWRAEAKKDLAYWNAGVLVLTPVPNEDAVRATVEDLLGKKGKRVGGAWIWDVGEGAPSQTGNGDTHKGS
ncbi:dolichyl-phosphate beta-glucosyltransferase [Streptomyces sp. NBC_01304]|uniref:dolichyl-phosphate beta-glucosyltransferase n=1 Tax=Streptomyces sp. NBC_01304 TaxID=2903818 RepID=UPI002E112A4D|nr:glycosyltransferase family 2 protein [Streptomyces sp. NBC_01304]